VNKWTIYQLWEYFKKKGEDPSVFWEAVKVCKYRVSLKG